MRTIRSIVGLLLLCSVVLAATTVRAQAAPAEPPKSVASADEAAIRALLAAQVAAWNKGDLEGYMAGYWNSPELTFYSGGSVTSGWRSTLERYRKAYQGGNRAMGQLEFKGLEVTPLSAEAAVARGHWLLRMPDGAKRRGLFTLVLRRFAEGWRIVHDHSSGG